ncbi:hypothetical protein ACLBOM_25135 [Escherichia coli]
MVALLSCTIPFFVVLASSSATAMQYPLPVLPLSRRALPRIPRQSSALSRRRRTASCLVAFVDAVVALLFAADACLVASSFEADADDADDAAERGRCGCRF